MILEKLRFFKANFIVFIILLVWVLALVIAPLTLPKNTLNLENDGRVGTKEFSSKFDSMNWFARAIYKSGDINCHQLAKRSYFINGNQMPYCARDVGVFFGLAIGTGITAFACIRIKWWWLVLGLIPIGVDGTTQLLTSYESTNLLRITTGGLAGIIAGIALGFIIFETGNIIKKIRTKKKI